MESKERGNEISSIPHEFNIERFQLLKSKLGARDTSVERLSLPRIVEATMKYNSAMLEKVEKYYVKVGWLIAAAEVARQISTVEAMERAEQHYVKGEFYRSAAEIAEKIGTPEALKRAKGYRRAIC